MSKWLPTEKIEYIDNKQSLGLKINWDKVRKEYKKLKIPKEHHYPLQADLSKFGYIIDLSDRSRGKTTNKLIVGLLLFKMYNIEMIYVRQSKSECTPKVMASLYATVLEYKYIDKIFGDEYNDIFYYGKRWTLCKRDDSTGDIVDKCDTYCTFCVGLDENDSLKSVLNTPRGDMIFHDEFITSTYRFNDFVRFCDICKTVIRERKSPVIFMSANTIDKNSQWFAELCIQKYVEPMEMGEVQYINENGTHIYLEILAESISTQRSEVNSRFWGFKNPKLASITGKGTWATEEYPHIPIYEEVSEEPEILQDILLVRMNGKYIKLRLVNDKTRGLCVFVTPATRVYNDNIILSVDEIFKKNELFGLAKDTFCLAYWKLFLQNKFYYARNSEGAFLKAYMSLVKSISNSR